MSALWHSTTRTFIRYDKYANRRKQYTYKHIMTQLNFNVHVQYKCQLVNY